MDVHWGTFRLCDDPLPVARARQGVADTEFALWALGETRVLRRAGS